MPVAFQPDAFQLDAFQTETVSIPPIVPPEFPPLILPFAEEITLASLLTRTATVYGRAASGAADAHGNSQVEEDSGVAYPCYLEQTDAKEIVVGRDTQMADYLLVLPKDAVIDGDDEVEVGGTRYVVVGPPGRWFDALLGEDGEHHVQAAIRVVSG